MNKGEIENKRQKRGFTEKDSVQGKPFHVSEYSIDSGRKVRKRKRNPREERRKKILYFSVLVLRTFLDKPSIY